MDKVKLVDDKACILIEFADKSKAVGFKCWLEGFYKHDQLQNIMKTGQVINIRWPISNVVLPAKRMLSEMNKYQSDDWTTCCIKVLDVGDWVKMFDSMQKCGKNSRTPINKIKQDELKKDRPKVTDKNIVSHGKDNENFATPQVVTDIKTRSNIEDSHVSNESPSDPKLVKRNKKKAMELNSNEAGDVSDTSQSDSKVVKRKKKEAKELEDVNSVYDDETTSQSTSSENRSSKKKKQKRHRREQEKDCIQNEETVESKNSEGIELPEKKKKKKKKNLDEESCSEYPLNPKSNDEMIPEPESTGDLNETQFPIDKTAENPTLSKKTKRKRKREPTQKEEKNDQESSALIDKFTSVQNADSTNQSKMVTNFGEPFPSIKSTLTDLKSDDIDMSTQASSHEQNLKNIKKSDKKIKEAAKKDQSMKAAQSVYEKMQDRKRKRTISESDDTESISSDEPVRKRTKAQLQADVTILQHDIKDLKKQLLTYRTDEKALSKSKDVLNNLKKIEERINKLSFTCQSCQKSQSLSKITNIETQPPLNDELIYNVDDSFEHNLDAHNFEKSQNAPPQISPIENSSSKEEGLPQAMKISTAFKTQNVDSVQKINSTVTLSSQETLDDPQKVTLQDVTPPVEMTNIGGIIEIPTPIFKKFRIKNYRHYLLDMMNASYTPTEFAKSTKSGRLGRGETVKDKEPLNANKLKAIVAHTATIFPNENVEEIRTQFTQMLTNKCKNTASALKNAAVKTEQEKQTCEK